MFQLIAGPCVIESEEMVLSIAGQMKDITDRLGIPYTFKASFDKANRTSLSSFRGPGIEEGLRILQKCGAETEEDARLVQSVIFSVPKYINFLDEGSLDRDEYKRLALAELPQRLHQVALKAADYPITELSVLPGMKELVRIGRPRIVSGLATSREGFQM